MKEYHADITNYVGREPLVVCECACVTMFNEKQYFIRNSWFLKFIYVLSHL